jgi:hypothetical protein
MSDGVILVDAIKEYLEPATNEYPLGRLEDLIVHCRGCGKDARIDQFKINPMGNFCDECRKRKVNTYNLAHNHATGKSKALCEARDSSVWLGVYIAESVLSKYFEDIKIMPYSNPGFDFICRRGFKIDAKSSCLLHRGGRKNPHWSFKISQNKIPDYFICIGFDNRENLTPMRIWLIPGEAINNTLCINVTNSIRSLSKWEKYEKQTDKAIAVCNTFKQGQMQ